MSRIVLKTDASVQSCGDVGLGVCVERIHADGSDILEKQAIPDRVESLYEDSTNTVDNAEFLALVRGMEVVMQHIEDDEPLKICLDSDNVVHIVDNRLVRFGETNHSYLYDMLDKFEWEITSIPRRLNAVADSMSKHATHYGEFS